MAVATATDKDGRMVFRATSRGDGTTAQEFGFTVPDVKGCHIIIEGPHLRQILDGEG